MLKYIKLMKLTISQRIKKLFGAKIDPTKPSWAMVRPYIYEAIKYYMPNIKVQRGYAKQPYDCQDYSRWMAFYVGSQVKAFLNNYTSFIRMPVVLQKHAFGGVPASDGQHQLNQLDLDDGSYILEPQTGAICKLKNYPNKDYILRYE